MRWQASLMPDPLMIPDATVFRHASSGKPARTKAIAAEQVTTSTYTQADSSKKRKRSKQIELQLPVHTENIFSPVEDMSFGSEPSFMSFLQEEEHDLAEQQIPTDSE